MVTRAKKGRDIAELYGFLKLQKCWVFLDIFAIKAEYDTKTRLECTVKCHLTFKKNEKKKQTQKGLLLKKIRHYIVQALMKCFKKPSLECTVKCYLA